MSSNCFVFGLYFRLLSAFLLQFKQVITCCDRDSPSFNFGFCHTTSDLRNFHSLLHEGYSVNRGTVSQIDVRKLVYCPSWHVCFESRCLPWFWYLFSQLLYQNDAFVDLLWSLFIADASALDSRILCRETRGRVVSFNCLQRFHRRCRWIPHQFTVA